MPQEGHFLEMSSMEEKNAKCNICADGLSVIEHILYGNRCVFCVLERRKIKLIPYLFISFFDFLIYKQKLRLCSLGDRGKMNWLAALGVIGVISDNFLSLTQKVTLLKELKKLQ